MPRCPSCDYPLPDNRERLGARCPNCRDPLYEPPGRVGRPARPDEGSCAAHAGVETVGICARCGNYLCEVCRTKWRDQILCGACVQRALDTREAEPGATRGALVQALLSLGMGVGAWVLTLAGFILIGLAVAGGGAPVLVLLFLAILLFAVLLAVIGVGQSAALLRARGNSMVLATIGLLVSCLHLGALIGVITISIWMN